MFLQRCSIKGNLLKYTCAHNSSLYMLLTSDREAATLKSGRRLVVVSSQLSHPHKEADVEAE